MKIKHCPILAVAKSGQKQ